MKKTIALLLTVVLALSNLFSIAGLANESQHTGFANSDIEGYENNLYYYVDTLDGNYVYRETVDFLDKEYLTDFPVSQLAIINGILYVSASNCIISIDIRTGVKKEILSETNTIERFSISNNYVFYLSDGQIHRYNLSDLSTTVSVCDGYIINFWLDSENEISYMNDNSFIYKLNFSTNTTTKDINNESSFGEYVPLHRTLEDDFGGTETISSLQNKFPAGKYWNHAGNPGNGSSVNNQNGYTSTPCPVHGNCGTSTQTCNGFAPNGTQLAWQCMGYAEKCGYDVTGYNPRNNANGWYTNSSSSALDNLKAGDIVRYKNNGHSIYVIGVSGDTVTYTDCNSDGHCIIRWNATISKSTLRSTFTNVRIAPSVAPGGSTVPSVTFTKNTSYPTPITTYPLATSGVITLYNSNLTAYSTSVRNISYSDLCTINAIYTNGYCSVSYPTSNGSNTEYAKTSDFISNGVTPYSWSPSQSLTTYTRSNLSTTFGSVFTSDSCKVVGKSGSKLQIIYPISGGYKMGWVNPPTVVQSDFPTPLYAYNASASVRTTVYESLSSMGTYWGQIFVDDLCTLNAINVSGGWIQVTYPAGSTNKTGYVYLDDFIPSNTRLTTFYTTTVTAQTNAYRKSDMATYYGYVSAGDQITVVGKVNDILQVVYPVDGGGYKLAWIGKANVKKNLTRIAVTSNPSKTSYIEGESLNTSGLVVTAYYDDGSSSNVTSSCSLSGYNNTVGVKTVTASYSGKTTAFSVNVKSKSPTGISVTSKPTKTTYYVGDTISMSGLSIKATYDNGTSATITDYDILYDSGLTSTAGTKTITVSYVYNNIVKTTSFTITVNAVTLSSISVKSKPTKTSYYVGDTLNTSGLALTATYNNGTTKNITSGFTCSPTSLSTAGTQTITVSYGGKTATFAVTVNAVTLSSISVKSKPTKTSYYVGDKLNTSGLALTATYNNGTTQNITSGFTCSPTSLSTAGTQTITVSYGGKAATFTVTVNPITISSISVNSNPTKTSYYVGETLNTAGLSLNVISNNGSSQVVTTGFSCTPIELQESGEQTIIVSYGGKTTSFTVTVIEKVISEDDPQFVVSSAKSAKGKTVDITVSVKNNPGIIAAKLNISYDPAKLTLMEVKNGTIMGNSLFDSGNDLAMIPYTVMWNDMDLDHSANGILVTFTFKVSDSAPLGDTPISITYDSKSTFNSELSNVTFGVINGKVEITDKTPADADGDGEITLKDVVLIRRYLSGGWDVQIDEVNSDVDGDLEVTLKDVVIIRRYLSGGWDIELE